MSKNQINPNCNRCKLHETATEDSICLKGKGYDRAPLLIVTDHPDYFADRAGRPYVGEYGKILNWMLRRMSVNPDSARLDYTLRCYPARNLPTTKAYRAECILECSSYRFATIAKCRPKSIVCLGKVSMEAFTGKTNLKDFEGSRVRAWEPVVRDWVEHVWIGYSIAYLMQYAGDAQNVYRVIFKAAEEAELNPKPDLTVRPYLWETF